jgi:hypothetical protein
MSNHADDKEAVAATLNTPQGKGKQVVDHGEGPSLHHQKKKNDKSRRDDNLFVAIKRKASRPKSNPTKTGPPKDHFEKFLEAPCTHHEVPVKHVLKDCCLMMNCVNGTLKPKVVDPQKKVVPVPNNNNDDLGAQYPGEDGAVHMIFNRSPARPSRHREKLIRRDVFNAKSLTPSYLKWLEALITLDRKDHPDHEQQPGAYPLVMAPLFRSKQIHEVLRDGGSSINMLYMSTLDDMGIP